MKYRCMACGYIYDEDIEGTKFEELPEEFFMITEADTKNKYLLLREIEDLTEEDIQYLCNSARYLKRKNQQIRKRK